VKNGKEGLDYLSQYLPPKVILLDLMMPIMNGWQFRENQIQDPRIASIPVVVVSADNDVKSKAVSLGVSQYLKKPIEIDQLLNMIQQYC